MDSARRAWLLVLAVVLAGAAPPAVWAFLGGGGSGHAALGGLPFRESTPLEQWCTAISGCGLKPLYMLLSLVLALRLRRCAALDLVALRWAMIAFFVGEGFCAVNYLVFADGSALSEYFHSYGMVLCLGLATFALLEGIDSRLFHYSDATRKCAALGLCRRCAKHDPAAPCGARRLFLFVLPACLVLCALPLGFSPRDVGYDTTILGTPHTFAHSALHQVFETRVCPAYAALFLCAALGVLVAARRDAVAMAKPLFAAGVGYLGFGLFRLILLGVFIDHLCWFDFWEEATELMSIAGVAATLWAFPAVLLREASS